ncbi:hypothetical protein SAMN05216296_1805 [Pseudomonas pohangensis]|jgi:hypothetical protein|uniref:DUF1993 domain-containing protein n=1 Tax=Pseudomonas pohangensis TaxID=364197 RepID=A0A1H2FTP7_9PSED|nr:DUF1993 domain-containing protein [Pseudomonas pohangensis]SDU10706.1 hypothetical protein SAMN05216296_1805 [Pseudomonas pohangensis]
MAITLYAASVPVFKQMLGSLRDILHKTEVHRAENNIEASALLQARLFPDMFALTRQVQIACDFARGITSRLAGVEVPKYDDNEQTFADLHELLDKTLAYLDSFTPEQINGQEQREIITRPGTPKERRFNGQDYLLSYGIPQFFFHVSTSYAILRHSGIAVGKRDYMGNY